MVNNHQILSIEQATNVVFWPFYITPIYFLEHNSFVVVRFYDMFVRDANVSQIGVDNYGSAIS